MLVVVRNSPEAGGDLVCDVRDIARGDERSLDALARLQLTARGMGTTIRLRNVSRALADLIELAGLADVFELEASVVEVHGQVEQREEPGVDEEVDPGDDAA